MPLQQADIRFARSPVMADVPEGGGPPNSQLIPDGASNTVFPDISEETRATGRVEIRQIHTVLRNTDSAALLGANVIVADPPNDPNVDITLMTTRSPFATRADIVKRIEASMSASVEFSGYLLGNHAATQRSLQLFQRPGAEPPGVGKVYMLVYLEDQPGELRQRVRIKSVDAELRTVSAIVNGSLVDFQAQVTTVELFDPLLHNFPGTDVRREFARDSNKTAFRETVYSDSGLFYGAAKIAAAADETDSVLQLNTVHSRLVPNSKTEAISTDQRPASDRTVLLAETPRRVEVGVTPHTQRIKIAAANLGQAYVFQLRPLPAPGTVVVSYWSAGQRYTITDDGEGNLTGAGSGMMSYLTGVVPVTLQGLPDVGTIVAISWGSPTAFDNRISQGASVRPPEYSFMLEGAAADGTGTQQVVPSSLSIDYTSGGTVYTITDDGDGNLTGAGSGVIDYYSRSVLLRPQHMPDPGAEFDIDYDLDPRVTEILTPGAPDPGGYITLTLADVPAAGTLQIQWAVARSVSNTSGGTLDTVRASKNATVTYTTRSVPEYYEPSAAGGINWPRSSV